MGSTFYLDPVNGNDSADGSTFALGGLPTVGPWLTIQGGATAARIAPGDVIRIAKSPDPTSLGINGTWTAGPVPAAKNIVSSTNATPIVMTVTGHGYVNGDVVFITGHTTNTNANSLWIVANKTDDTFELQGSVGNGVGGATGTVCLYNARVVKLASALNAIIDNCDVAWTTADAAKCTVTLETTIIKEGYGSAKFALLAGLGLEKFAYRTLPSTLDLSGYQQISFCIKPSIATFTAGNIQIKLCSDSVGAVAVDTFDIPAMNGTNWHYFTVNKGSALGSAIASIGIYQAGTDRGACTVYLDNLIACKASSAADSLSLTSLISKNSAAQGGTEAWYPIDSIKDTLVVLGGNCAVAPGNTAALSYACYYGATETVPTYKRETFKYAASTIIQDSGSPTGGYIDFEGGYDTSLNTQIGETFFDGINQGWNVLQLTSWIKTKYLNYSRYSYGITMVAGSHFNYIEMGQIMTLENPFLQLPSPAVATVVTGNYFNFNMVWGVRSYAIAGQGAFVKNIIKITSLHGNYTSSGGTITLLSVEENTFIIGTIYDLNPTAVEFPVTTTTNYFTTGTRNKLTFESNYHTTAGILMHYGVNELINTKINETTEVSFGATFRDARIFSRKHDKTAGNHWMFTDGGTINLQTSIMHGTIGAWKYIITSSDRHSGYPLWMPLIRIQVTSGVTYTVKAWCKLDHATQVGAKLVCRGGQVAGIDNDVVATKTGDTDWQELSIVLSPTEDGVVDIEAQGYYLTANNNVYFDSEMTVTPS